MLQPVGREPQPMSHTANSRVTGAIRKLKDGYGFIAGDDGRDYFFHWSAMDRTSKNFKELSMQERVNFLVADSPKGVRAVMIRVIE
jgi:cold shock protein